jgi:hypothetical protein
MSKVAVAGTRACPPEILSAMAFCAQALLAPPPLCTCSPHGSAALGLRKLPSWQVARWPADGPQGVAWCCGLPGTNVQASIRCRGCRSNAR